MLAPQNPIRHHPAVGQIHILSKLNGDHLLIDLNDNSLEPISNAFVVLVVITQHIDDIAYSV